MWLSAPTWECLCASGRTALAQGPNIQYNTIVSRELRRESIETVTTFTPVLVTSAIKRCSISGAFGPNELSVFLNNIGPKANILTQSSATQYPYVGYHRWKSSLSAARTLFISINSTALSCCDGIGDLHFTEYQQPALYQHGFWSWHSTTSALSQFTLGPPSRQMKKTLYSKHYPTINVIDLWRVLELVEVVVEQ